MRVRTRTPRAKRAARRCTARRSPAISRSRSYCLRTALIRTRRTRRATRHWVSLATGATWGRGHPNPRRPEPEPAAAGRLPRRAPRHWVPLATGATWGRGTPTQRGHEPEPSLEDRLSERARDQLHGERRGAVALIEDGIDLGDLDRAELPGCGEHLHGELRLAVSEAAAHRRPHARRLVRIERVHVQRKMDAVALARDSDRLLHRRAHAETIDVRHRERGHARLLDVVALARIHVAQAQQHAAVDARRPAKTGGERVTRKSESHGEGHSVHVP